MTSNAGMYTMQQPFIEQVDIQKDVEQESLIDSCYAKLSHGLDLAELENQENEYLCKFTVLGIPLLSNDVRINVKDMELYINSVACSADEILALLNNTGCQNKNDMTLYKAANVVKQKNIWKQIKKVHSQMLNMIMQNESNLQYNAYTGTQENNTDTCVDIMITIRLSEEDEKNLKTAIKVMSLISEINDDCSYAFLDWKNLDKMHLRQFLCPTSEVKIALTEIDKFTKLKNHYDCLMENSKRFIDNDKKDIDKETEILKNSLDFLKEYIELVDHCIICVQNNLRCSLKNDAFDPKNPNACHVIRPINYENRNNAVIRYLKLNHYKKTKSGAYNQNNKKLSDAILAYDHNQYNYSIDKKFKDIVQRLTEVLSQDHCYTNHDVRHVTTYSNNTTVSDINHKNDEQKTTRALSKTIVKSITTTQLPIATTQKVTTSKQENAITQENVTTTKENATTKQENTTTEKNSDLHGASDSVAKKCFAIVLMSTLLLRLFN
ncbi:hypothetical protein BDAP_000969 [Binucleata daphniae]